MLQLFMSGPEASPEQSASYEVSTTSLYIKCIVSTIIDGQGCMINYPHFKIGNPCYMISGVAIYSPTIWSRYANFNSSLLISLETDCVDSL